LNQKHPNGFYDSPDPNTRHQIFLVDFPLLDEDGLEIPIYESNGRRVLRRTIVIDDNQPSCPVLIDLTRIQALFKPNSDILDIHSDDDSDDDNLDDHLVRVDAYPLGFLKNAGNIQATGVPHCFYPVLKDINRSVRSNSRFNSTPSIHSDNDDDDPMQGDHNADERSSSQQVVKPVSAQFYNYVAHRVATRAGRHDSQHGHATAAISGAYSTTAKDKATASNKQSYCEHALPSDRFHNRISIERCPTSCRAELVYSIDVRALEDPSGSYVLLTYIPLPPLFHLTFIYAVPYSTTSSSLSPMLGERRMYVLPSTSTWSSSGHM
jgi:hypothetical protein